MIVWITTATFCTFAKNNKKYNKMLPCSSGVADLMHEIRHVIIMVCSSKVLYEWHCIISHKMCKNI